MKILPRSVAGNDFLGHESVLAGCREVLYWRIGDKRWRWFLINGIVLASMFPALALFGWLGEKIGRRGLVALSGGIGTFLLLLAALLVTFALHELAHGLAMQACGAHPRYGIMLKRLMIYATAPGHAFTRLQYLAAGLAPLVILSLASMAGMYLLAGTRWAGLLATCGAANAVGAAGDLWILGVVLSHPRNARFVDEQDGVRVLLPAAQTARDKRY